MTEPKVIHCENEKDWLSEREKLAVTASDAYTMLTRPNVHYARKKGLLDGPEQSERMLWGKRLQTAVAQGFSEDTGRPVTLCAPFDIYVHPAYPMVGATPDAIETIQEPKPVNYEPIPHDGLPMKYEFEGPLEIKVTDFEWEDEPPVWYQAQLQCQLSVLGMKMGTLAALHRGNKLIWADLMRHEEFIKRFLSKAEEMAWRLATNNPPTGELDGSKETAEAIAALFPRDMGTTVALPPEALDWTEELERLKAQKKKLEEDITLRENRIKEAIKDAAYGQLANGARWSWKLQTRVDPPRLEERVTQFRVLRFLKGNG